MSELFEAPSLEYLAERLPQFEFESFIAQGGMGAVYRARQISLDRVVAIKILPQELGEDEEFRESFSKEAKAMAKLNHPNLIGVFDSGDIDGMPYIVMEYIEGASLHDACWGEKLELSRAVDIVLGICKGLVDAHDHGIIHRDIKPANILLTSREEPKIGDFGLAHPSDSDELGLIMGTPGYTSPETFDNPEQAGVLADQYSVGVILHQLTTGLDPQGSEGPPTTPTGNIKLDGIWRKATQPDPAKRYPSMAAMVEALESWKAPKPAAAPAGRVLNVGAPQIHPAHPVQLKSAKSGGMLTKLVVLALLAFGAWYGYGKYQESQEIIDKGTPGEPSPSTPPPSNPPPKPNRPKPDRTVNRPKPDDTNPSKPPKNDRLSRKERRDLKNERRKSNPQNPAPVNPAPEIPTPAPPAVAELEPGDPQLRDKAAALIVDARKKRDALLQKNSQEFRRVLEYEAARAARDESRVYEGLRKQSESGWVPEPADMPAVNESISRVHLKTHREQVSIASKHIVELTRIRDYYVPMLQKKAEATSDADQKERLLAQAKQAQDLTQWVAILAPEPPR